MVRNELWIITTLISVGVIGGLFYNWPNAHPNLANDREQKSDPSTNVENNIAEVHFSAAPELIESQELKKRIEDGDDYLLVGNFVYAISYFNSVYELFPHEVPLLLRLGLAHEMNSQPTRAQSYYRKAMLNSRPNLNHWLAANLGLIRCNGNSGKEIESIRQLAESFLRFSDAQQVNDDLRFELGYQLAKSWRGAAIGLNRTGSEILESLQFEQCQVKVDTMISLFGTPNFGFENLNESSSGLDAIETSVEKNSMSEQEFEMFRDLSLIQRPSDNLSLMVVSGSSRTIPISEFLRKLGDVIGLTISVSSEVAPYLNGRTVKFESSALPVALMLDCALSPLKLAWEQRGLEVVIEPFVSYSDEMLMAFHAGQALRMGRFLIINHPTNKCVNELRLAHANLHFLLEEYDEASVLLKQLAAAQQVGELNAKVHLTMALIEIRFGRYKNAIPMLVAVGDQSTNDRLKAIAYAQIGKIYLNEYEIEPSIIASSRSLALTDVIGIRAIASLNLARAYMFANDPLSANRVLFDNSFAFADGTKEQSLAFAYSAFARSLATSSPIRRRKAVETTLISLAGIDEKLWALADVDCVLLARAYRQVGLIDQAISILEYNASIAEKRAQGHWRRLRRFELASLLFSEHQTESAIELYVELATNLSDDIGKESKLKLAIFELEEKQNAVECLHLCRELWESELSNKLKESTLKTMGHAYNAQGRVALASYCFLGMLPDKDE